MPQIYGPSWARKQPWLVVDDDGRKYEAPSRKLAEALADAMEAVK